MVKSEMQDTPAASPSKPSIKLTALVKARIQKMVIGRLRYQGKLMVWPVKGIFSSVIRISAKK